MAVVAPALLCLTACEARAAAERAIDDAVGRGVALLKSRQQPDGSWPYYDDIARTDSDVTGPTSLAALTLLECGVPGKDPVVQKAAGLIRQAAFSMTDTYSLALAVMFFDKLGADRDVPLIQALTVRILAGEGPMGGWTYQCPAMGAGEARNLRQRLQQSSELVTRRELPKTTTPAKERELPPEIREQLARIENGGRRQPAGVLRRRDDWAFGDNSNTQFACLALWVARRHHLPVDNALERVAARFRTSQHADGGWGYTVREGTTKAADTCIGLFALAMGRGVAQDRHLRADKLPRKNKKQAEPLPPAETDAAIRRGLMAVASLMRFPEISIFPNGRIRFAGRGRDRINCYFLWSLERMAVVYGLKTVGKKDWYAWGSTELLARQRPDGGWEEQYHPENIDTCFALLFLRRANLATDLTTMLDRQVRDPGKALLRAGGVGGEALRDKDAGRPPEAPVRRLAPPDRTAAVPDRPERSPVKPEPAVPTAKPRAQAGGQTGEAPKSPLSAALVEATGERQEALISEYEQANGIKYTEALADAIHHLRGPARTRAQSALTERLSHLKGVTLRVWLQDDDAELRRAAALACAAKQDDRLVPALIERLRDADAHVAKAAHLALKTLTQQDFGPGPGADAKAWAEAADKWQAWWKKKG
jgi:hypothetical protein